MDDATRDSLGLPSTLKPGPSTEMVANMVAGNRSKAQALNTAEQAETAPLQAGVNQDMQARAAYAAKGPEREALPQTPKPKASDLQGIFGALMVFAALAGGQAKRHATGALTAMNGVLEGMHAGDQEKTALAFKQYEADSKRAIELNHEKLDAYTKTLNSMSLGIDTKLEQLRQIALKYQDQQKLQLFSHGDIAVATQAVHADAEATRHAEERSDKWAMHNDSLRRAPSGYRYDEEGNLGAIPGGPGDPQVKSDQRGLSAVQVATVEKDLFETRKFLDKARSMGSNANASAFFMDHAQPGFMGRWVKKELTSEEQQLYDVYANRVANAIVGMQSVGRYRGTNVSIEEAKKLVPVPGDTQNVIKAKLDYIEDFAQDTDQTLARLSKSHKGSGTIPEFASDAEAEAAKLAPGTRVKIGGVSGTWH